jgi:hypothetical protein
MHTVVAAACAGAVVAFLPRLSAEPVLPYLALAVPVAVLAWCRARLQPVVLSPLWILVLVLVAVGALGHAFHGELYQAGGGSITLSLSSSLAGRTAYLFAGFASAIAIAGALTSLMRRPQPRGEVKPTIPPPQLLDLSLSVSGTLILCGWLTYGTLLFNRGEYLVPRGAGGGLGGVIAIVGALAATIGTAAVSICGYVMAVANGSRKLMAVLIAAAFFVYYFGGGTRRLALFPLLFAIGYLFGRRDRRGVAVLGVAAFLSVLLLPVPLYLRGQGAHGLLPYLDAMAGLDYTEVDWLSSINNILISFPITAYSAFEEAARPTAWLWLELNPLPGDMVGWYEVSRQLRLNDYTPFSSIGGLGNYGTLAVIGVGCGLGIILAYLDGRVSYYVRIGSQFIAVGIVGASGLLAVTALQYNVRSFARLVLYLVILELAARFHRSLTARKAVLEPEQTLSSAYDRKIRHRGVGRWHDRVEHPEL